MPAPSNAARCITSFALFDSLSHGMKQAYIDTVQDTYHASLTEIGEAMGYDGTARNSFCNYLNAEGIHGNRSAGCKKTSPLWPYFVAGLADSFGNPLIDQPFLDRSAPPAQRATLELSGSPETLLKILSTALAIPANTVRLVVQEVTVA